MSIISGESDVLREEPTMKVHSLPRHRGRWFSGRVRQLPASRMGMLGKTLVLLILARSTLLVIPVRFILKWKSKPFHAGREYTRRELLTTAREAAWAVERLAERSPIKVGCFTQCLAAAALLRSAGVDSRLHHGVGRVNGRLVTHTWLESAGEVLVGREAEEGMEAISVY